MFNYKRRKTTNFEAGNIKIGENFPIRVQTMANTDTNDIDASVKQAEICIENGTELLRYTTQGKKEAENLGRIKTILKEKGLDTPIVADIHFNPSVAEVAAKLVDKIRINPGNFVSSKDGDYTEAEWTDELERIKAKLFPLLEVCKEHKIAIRIGVNHGSLSSRIINRYGNTPEGLAASCMEFIALCEEDEFTNLILSIKASNTRVMIQAVRLLVAEMEKSNRHYPLHLGVTEAGSDDEGRIKSAVGIGTLLSQGIGDTIRVSLSEKPEAELPVAKKLVDYVSSRANHEKISGECAPYFSWYKYQRRKTTSINNIGGDNAPIVVSSEQINTTPLPDYYIGNLPAYITLDCENITKSSIEEIKESQDKDKVILLTTKHQNPVGSISAAIHHLTIERVENPVVVKREYHETDIETFQIKAAADLGPLLIDGLIDGIYLTNSSEKIDKIDKIDKVNKTDKIDKTIINETAFEILQSSRARISTTEYISCPSCGRTKFDLPSVVREVKKATKGYVGLKIAIMGCIVNGPGEMADADFGYIGAGMGKVSLYKGNICIEKNIPENEAIDALINLINKYKVQ
ncbi:MAG: (E)-4-hydroxy-3-methylbut-2-enyl-diphosphate synthase [bacterium]